MQFPVRISSVHSWIPINPISLSVYFSLFGVVSLLELLACALEKEKMRIVLKPFCAFVLFFAVWMSFPLQWAFYLGLLFGVIGDLFLIYPKNPKCLGIGIFSFLLEHVLLMTETSFLLAGRVGKSTILALSLSAVLFYALAVFLTSAFYRLKGVLLFGGSLYALALVGDLVLQILGFVLRGGGFLYGIPGGLFFLASDFILTFTLFKKDFRRSNLPIMLTYLVAQLFYTLSLSSALLEA